jgi:hypothetical protein
VVSPLVLASGEARVEPLLTKEYLMPFFMEPNLQVF